MADLFQMLQQAGSMALQGQVPPTDLLKQLVSKGLGYGIIAGSTMVKLPQVAKIVQARSAAGLSALSFELEAWVLLVHCVYGAATALPFSAYGEAILLLAQTLLIVGLIYRYGGAPVWRMMASSSVLVGFAGAVASGQLGRPLISALYDANNLLVLVARLPQIAQNLRTQSTGQLSLVTYGVQAAGCLARIFTTRQEGGGSAMLRAYVIALGLNLTLVAQILLYGGSPTPATTTTSSSSTGAKAKAAKAAAAAAAVPPTSPARNTRSHDVRQAGKTD